MMNYLSVVNIYYPFRWRKKDIRALPLTFSPPKLWNFLFGCGDLQCNTLKEIHIEMKVLLKRILFIIVFFFFFVMGWNYTSEITRKNKRLTKGQSQEERERQSPNFIDPHSTNNFKLVVFHNDEDRGDRREMCVVCRHAYSR